MEAQKAKVLKKITKIGVVLGAFLFLALSSQLFETNNKGQFQVKQAAITGTMTVRTKPGTYPQLFGDITTWDKNGTFFFTADSDEGASHDESIEVRFVDGSLANISGTMRISLPRTQEEIIKLVDELGFKSWDHLEAKLIKPTVRNALRLTANFMTARESYADKRPDYNTWAWDQIQNGLYKTKEIKREILDPATGKMVKKVVKTILKDKNGEPIYTKNPLAGTGIVLSNFEVKSFVYEDKVKEQIAKQQELYMSIATAKAEAAKAQQDEIKEAAQGKAREAKAEADANVIKRTAVIEEQKLKEVAVLKAQKLYEVEKLAARQALEKAKKIRAEGMAKAAANKALVAAGLTPRERAQYRVKAIEAAFNGWSKRPVPTTIMGMGGNSGKGGSALTELLSADAALNLMKKFNQPVK